jgi:predicted oxidoreductase
MKTVTLGQSSLQCSRLAYGCWRLAGTWNPEEVDQARLDAGGRAILAAYEAGFTLFDHADIYCQGIPEQIFGQILHHVPGMRERVLIATKCGIRRKGDPHGDSPYRYDTSSAHIIASCEASLVRLGVETIDIFQLHRPDYLADPDEIAAAFTQLKKDGKAREFGLSNTRPSLVTALQRTCPMPLIVNQVEISLARLEPFTDGTLDQCLSLRMTPLAWSPLGGGSLGTSHKTQEAGAHHPVVFKLIAALDVVAEARGVSRTAIALAWLLKHPAGIVPIIGSTNPERIAAAAEAAEIILTREEWYGLLEAARGDRLP